MAGSAGLPGGGNAGLPGGGNAGVSSGAGGSDAGAGGAPSAGSSGSSGASSSCERTITPEPSSVLLQLPIEFVAGSAPLELGVAVKPTGSSAYRADVVSFFFSRAVLIGAEGVRVPARFADSTGAQRPYDLLLVRADDPPPLSLDLLAPPGRYTALELGIGVPAGCNHIDPTTAVFPLNASTGLYWSWAMGYIFIRAEGQLETEPPTWNPFAYHIGFDDAYRTITLEGSLVVPAAGAAPHVVVDMNHFLDTSPRESMHSRPDLDLADRFADSATVSLRP